MRLIEAGGPTTQQSLCARNKIDRTTMVQLLDQLEERQLVLRQPSSTDRRANLIFLTPRGRKTLSRATRLVKKEQEKFLAPLAPEEWESLRQQLIKLLEHNFDRQP
jgi:DNA-binding MarR family transcriptional regulator